MSVKDKVWYHHCREHGQVYGIGEYQIDSADWTLPITALAERCRSLDKITSRVVRNWKVGREGAKIQEPLERFSHGNN